MNRKLPKIRALARLQLSRDKLDEPLYIRTLKLLQKRLTLLRLELRRLRHEPLQRILRKRIEAQVIAQRIGLEDRQRHRRRIEFFRQIRSLVAHFLFVIEVQAQPLFQVRQRPLRILVVVEQRPTIQYRPATLAFIRKPLRPLRENLRQFGLVAHVLIMQRVEKIIVFGARHQLAEHLRAIRSQRELFDETDFVFRPGVVRHNERR